MNKRRKLQEDPSINKSKLNKLVKKVEDISHDFEKVFLNNYHKTPDGKIITIHAAIYSPLTFLMTVFNAADAMGLEPSKEFPTFMTVYTNYLKAFSEMEEDWNKLPFKEFEKKFEELYEKNTHFVVDAELFEEKNDDRV